MGGLTIVDPDPYDPPWAPSRQPTLLGGKLYTANQIGVAAWIGSPLAAVWLLMSNFAVIGDVDARWRALAWGLVGTSLLVGITFILPESFPGGIIPFGYAIALREIARLQQGREIKQHLEAGGQSQSWWRVLGIAVVALAGVVGAMGASALGLGMVEMAFGDTE